MTGHWDFMEPVHGTFFFLLGKIVFLPLFSLRTSSREDWAYQTRQGAVITSRLPAELVPGGPCGRLVTTAFRQPMSAPELAALVCNGSETTGTSSNNGDFCQGKMVSFDEILLRRLLRISTRPEPLHYPFFLPTKYCISTGQLQISIQ